MAYGYKRKRRYSRKPYRRAYRRRGYRSRSRSHFAPRTTHAARVPRALVALADRIRGDPGFASAVKTLPLAKLFPAKQVRYVKPPRSEWKSWEEAQRILKLSPVGRKVLRYVEKARGFYEDPMGVLNREMEKMMWRTLSGEFVGAFDPQPWDGVFPGGMPTNDDDGEL